MLKQIELDPTFRLREQYADTSNETTILADLFDFDPKDQENFKAVSSSCLLRELQVRS